MTYGAPAAHVFKFKGGGLGRAEAKLAKEGQKQAESRLLPDERVARLRLKFVAAGRACVAVSQALGAVVAAAADMLEDALTARIGDGVRDAKWRVMQWCSADVGLLVHEVSLLSTHGKEEGMIDDMASALDRLQVTLRIVPPAAGNSSAGDVDAGRFRVVDVAPKSSSSQEQQLQQLDAADLGSVVVTLSVGSREDYDWLASCSSRGGGTGESDSVNIEIRSVLMTLGVNEFQTLANASNATELQTRVNRRGVEGMRRYHEAFSVFQERRRRAERDEAVPATPAFVSTVDLDVDQTDHGNSGEAGSEGGTAAECGRLLDTLSELVEEEAAGTRRKIVDLLLVSCYAARLMHGARTTSCKSAKDRTSMFQSLESVRWAQRQGVLSFGDAGKEKEGALLELLRGPEGVRLKNCSDNIGKALYTFNGLQLSQLPSELRPAGVVSGAGKS